MLDWLQQIIAWVTQHPQLAGLAVFLVALSESLAVVGLAVPGAVMMFGAGALIATGALDFWSTFWLAVLGAVLGDGLSYALGRHYHHQLRQMWPFRRNPDMLTRGETFFRKHGGKSVIIARFIGPLRPVLPVVAGMLDMPARRFLSVNLLSALAWAPAYLLPGMAFGASLAIAGEVAGRLALLLTLLLALFWLLFWLAHRLYRFLQPHAKEWGEQLLRRSQKHRWSAWLVTGLLDPQRRASSTLLVWLLVLLGGTWLFLGVLEDVLSDDPLVSAGYGLYQLLQGLRTPLADEIMVALSALGDISVILVVVLSAVSYQLWRRQWHEALYWLASLGFALAAVAVLKAGLQFPRPIDLYSGVDSFSFPSGHATFATVVYGYLAMLIAAQLPLRWHWLSYACGSILIGGIAFSRLYLGAHWLADVAAGFGLGTAWVALLAIARHYHLPAQPPRRTYAPGLILVTLSSLLLAGGWHISRSMEEDLARYAIQHHLQRLAKAEWLSTAWQQLPAYRIDLKGEEEQPLNIQLVGDLDPLREKLLALGWRQPIPITPRSAMYWFAPEPNLASLPVLPQIHNGHREALLLVNNNKDHHFVLRLWSSSARLTPGEIPLWLGTISQLRLQCLPLLCFPRTGTDYTKAQQALAAMLKELPQWQRQRRIDTANSGTWQGQVLLVQSMKNP